MGDIQRMVDEKFKVEEAQRQLRKVEESPGRKWTALFFNNTTVNPVFERPAKPVGEQLHSDRTMGVWKLDQEKWKNGIKKPFHGTLAPEGDHL